MQYWDEVLYPSFRASIRGDLYGVMSRDDMDELCYHLACRAISAFKFPRIATNYRTFYAIREEDDPETLVEVSSTDDNAIPHGQFLNNLTYAEIEIILAWMKVYWCEQLLSNADNFEDIYTDANIKTYSRANMVQQNVKLLEVYRKYARNLETRYSRVRPDYVPTMGEINGE